MMEKEKDASVYFFLFFQLVLLHRKQLRENVSHQGLPVRKSVKINPTERVVMNASSHWESFCQFHGMVKRQEERQD